MAGLKAAVERWIDRHSQRSTDPRQSAQWFESLDKDLDTIGSLPDPASASRAAREESMRRWPATKWDDIQFTDTVRMARAARRADFQAGAAWQREQDEVES